MNIKSKTLVRVAMPLLIALLSIFVLSGIASSPTTYRKTITSLDEKKTTVMGLAAASTATSSAITLIPGDTATPIADELAELSTYFLVVLGAIYLEKYLLTIIGFVTFKILIPAACILAAINVFYKSDVCRAVIKKLTIIGIVILCVIPASEKISRLIQETNDESIQMTMELATQEVEFEENEKGGISAIFSKVKEGVTETTQKVENVLTNFIEAIAIMMSWLMGMQFIKGKIPRMYILFALIGFLMIILYLRAMDVGSGSKTSPTISKEQQTNESEGIYTYQIRNYVGKNVASVGKISGSSVVDTYGSGELRIVFVTEDGMFINPSDEEQKQQYVVVEQSLEKDSNITIVHLRNSSGEPYSNLVDYQSYEEIILYVAPIGNNDTFKPVVEKINPTLDRHKFYVRDYVGKNAASFGKVNNSNRTDSYGAGGLRISFISEDGTYIEASNINELKNYIIIAQDIKANTELNLDYETNSLDEEYHNLIRNQNYEEINLTVRKLDESIVEKMLEIEDADKNSY